MTRWLALLIFISGSLKGQTLFSPGNMTSQVLPTPYVATATSAYPDNPCPALPTVCGGASYQPEGPFQFSIGGGSWTGMNNGVDALKLDIGAGNLQVLSSYKLTVNTLNRAPKDWTLKGSTDDITYTTLDTRTNQTTWTSGVEVSYTCNGGITTSYRYFKFDITANQGQPYTEIGNLKFYDSITGVGTGGATLSGVGFLNGVATQK